MSIFPKTQIHPTPKTPLVMVTKNTKSYVLFTKFWVEHGNVLTAAPKDTLRYCTLKVMKQKASVHAHHENLLMHSNWGTAKDYEKGFAGVMCLYYNVETDTFLPNLFKNHPAQTPHSDEERLERYKFACNTDNNFTLRQAKLLWYSLHYTGPNQANTKEMALFLSMWPNIEKITPLEIHTQITNLESQPPNFPTTIDAALQIQQQTSATLAKPIAQQHRPLPLIITPQPTKENSIESMFLNNPINHGHLLPRQQPSGQYRVWVEYTAPTHTKMAREIVYACPLIAGNKNPNGEPFPIGPLKADVSLLFWNANKEDAENYGQPIVVSINTRLESHKVAEFWNTYGELLNETQQRTLNISVSPHIQQDTSTMLTKYCQHCKTEIRTTKSNLIYCSPQCRIAFNAGKTLGQSSTPRTPKANKRAETRELIASFKFHGIKFPNDLYYTGAEYTESGEHHSKDYVDMPWRAKRYTEQRIAELFARFPVVFEGCEAVVLPDYD